VISFFKKLFNYKLEELTDCDFTYEVNTIGCGRGGMPVLYKAYKKKE